ncbi:MAG: response regulator [Deltaproteobacteria bacterium]|nr:response regulator [Deltaproteobacteria bacterium]
MIAYEISSPLPEVVIGDKGRLRQVLTNLLGNAIKFTPFGSIDIKVREYNDSTSLSHKDNDIILLISVEDTGVGIPPEQSDKIFEAFIQGDASSSKRYRGTGLGLAITKRLVEAMGGNIWMESLPGLGSVFFFTARFEIGSESDIMADNPTGQHIHLALSPLKILLAEDDLLNQKFGIEILQCQGHTVTPANNGQEVLELLNKEVFDLILMDVSMPEIDGIEVTKEIRSSSSNKFDKNIPIIAQTAHVIKGDREKFLQVGMDGYIVKPIDVDRLVEEISRIAPRFVTRQTGKDDRNQITSIDEGRHPVIDLNALRRRFNGKKDFFVELFEYFLDEFPKRMTDINAVIETCDLERLSDLAHSFNGVAATICAAEIAYCSAKLHQAAREDDLERAKLYVKELSLALERISNISLDDYLCLLCQEAAKEPATIR